MTETRDLLVRTAALSADVLESLDARPVLPGVDLDALRAALTRPLQNEPMDASEVLEQLVADADPGIAGMPGGRWFGFVLGGSLPAALAADWMTSTWDQNAGLFAPAPSAAVVEEVAGEWLRELFGLPQGVSYAFVTGCQMAHVTALAAAREHELRELGWELSERGLYGAPPVRVLVGAKRHVTIDRALRLLGMGAPEIVRADDQGRMVVDDLKLDERPTIVCAQVGEVNTGACDDVEAIAAHTHQTGAWLHVDGAFGLWAAVSPSLRHLVRGVEQADSWATDAHKWLNVPYDSGLAFCAHPDAHRAVMGVHAEYLVYDAGANRDQARLEPGVLAPRARLPDLCGPSLSRALRRLRARRALLRARAARRRGARAAPRRRGVERRRPEPGAVPLRDGRAYAMEEERDALALPHLEPARRAVRAAHDPDRLRELSLDLTGDGEPVEERVLREPGRGRRRRTRRRSGRGRRAAFPLRCTSRRTRRARRRPRAQRRQRRRHQGRCWSKSSTTDRRSCLRRTTSTG